MPTGTATFRTRVNISGQGTPWTPPPMSAAYPTTDEVFPAILAAGTRWTRRLEVFEADGETIYIDTNALLDGSVSVDGSRDERRTIECTLDNTDGEFDNFPGGFWYDKVIKMYRGVLLPDGRSWEYQIGEFISDDISSQNFPHTVGVKGRDYTKKLLLSKFPAPTMFVQGTSIERVIRDVATNGGISKFQLPVTGKTLGKDFLFDKGTTRWKCISDICSAYGYEIFFDPRGYLVMREFLDPVASAVAFTFQTGPSVGNIARFSKKTNDSRIYNHVVVTGASSDSAAPPVWAEAINTEPSSPTNTTLLGDRVYEFASPFITTKDQAQDTADKFLKIHALEQFEITIDSLVFPWLEANTITRFVDPDPNPTDPDRFLLTSFGIPVKLGSMSSSASRVTLVS
jgi:hypothetical protein